MGRAVKLPWRACFLGVGGLLLVLWPVACRKTPGPRSAANRLRIAGLELHVASGLPALTGGVGKVELERWVREEIARGPSLLLEREEAKSEGLAGRDRGAVRLRVKVGRVGDHEGQSVGMVSVSARRARAIDGPSLQSSVAFPLAGTNKRQRERLRRAVAQAVSDVDFQAMLSFGGEKQVLDALTRLEDEHRILSAIDVAALKKVRRAVPILVRLLKHRDERVADRAVGALVAIGDRRAVGPLTRLAKFEDTEKVAKLIDGIAALGGAEARSYLEFVAGGHPDPDIRDLASEALRRTRRAIASDGGS